MPSDLIVVDPPLTAEDAREVVAHANSLGKPIARLYISHGHPDHFAAAILFDAPIYALEPVARRIQESGEFAIRGSYQLTSGHEGVEPPSIPAVDNVLVGGGEEVIDRVRFSFERTAGGDTTDQLVIGLPDDEILIAQDVLYNRVHAFIAERTFDAWNAAIDALEARPYNTILPGHGVPGDRALNAATREYLTAARKAFDEASGPNDLSRRLEAAFPDYGGTSLHPLRNFFLYPSKP